MIGYDIPKNMHQAEARAPSFECSLGRATEVCSPTLFCHSKRESDEVAADRSDKIFGRPGLAQAAVSTARELRHLAPDLEVIFPRPYLFVGKTKIRLYLLIMTIKYDMQKYARR